LFLVEYPYGRGKKFTALLVRIMFKTLPVDPSMQEEKFGVGV